MIRVRFWPAVLWLTLAAAITTQAQTQPTQTPPPVTPPAMSSTQPATTQPAAPPAAVKPTPPPAPATQPAAKNAGTQPTKPPPKAAKLDQPEGKTPAQPPAPRVTEPKTAKPTEPPTAKPEPAVGDEKPAAAPAEHAGEQLDLMSMVFVFMLATFLGIGIIRRVSRLLHTPLMSLTNAISAIAVVGSIMLAGGREYPVAYKIVGAVAIFASMTNIISGFLITDRMLKMFKSREGGKA